MPGKVDADAAYFPMDQNDNGQEPGETKQNEVYNDKHATVPAQIQFTPGSPNYHSIFSNRTSRFSKLIPSHQKL